MTVDISETLQVVALPRNAKMSLDEAAARSTAQMIFQSGEALTQALRQAGMLQDMKRTDGVAEANCTVFSKVIRYFAHIVYVIVRPGGYAPHPEFHDPLCM